MLPFSGPSEVLFTRLSLQNAKVDKKHYKEITRLAEQSYGCDCFSFICIKFQAPTCKTSVSLVSKISNSFTDGRTNSNTYPEIPPKVGSHNVAELFSDSPTVNHKLMIGGHSVAQKPSKKCEENSN